MAIKNENHLEVHTREEYKRIKAEENKAEMVAHPKKKRIRMRLIPIWLRTILLVVLVSISLVAGATVGYGTIGGGKVADVFKMSTWTHIQDLVVKGD